MSSILIVGGRTVNRGQIRSQDIFIKDGRIQAIGPQLNKAADVEIRAEGKLVLPGIIDDQVHFREPGLTHKAEIETEARAAVAGGVTSFMEMPNTKPPALTQALLEEKYQRAAQCSLANYSFFMGASNDNLEEVLKTDPERVCGIKVFMGSSTGNMLVDDEKTLTDLFSKVDLLIATHCEDEKTIRANEAEAREEYGEDVPMAMHPKIRSAAGCLKSSSLAVELAREFDTRLHILHISTAEETMLFEKGPDPSAKRITSEACVHHLYFDARDYEKLGSQIKCNPAIKGQVHRDAVRKAVVEDRIDIIATDHAPHTWEEKQNSYFNAPSGVPLVQHSLQIMLELHQEGLFTLEQLVHKMCHAPAMCFGLVERGFLEEGYWADVVIVDPEQSQTVNKDNIHYKCGWSPFEGHTFGSLVESTIVSGHLAWHNGAFRADKMGERLLFSR